MHASKTGILSRPAFKTSPVLAALVLVIALTAGGCAGTTGPAPEPLTVTQIVTMSQQGVPPQEIITQIRSSGTVYKLSGSQIAALSREGVSDQVLNYMQQTYIDAVRQNQAWQDQGYWTMGGDGYWYGGMPYGWSGYGPLVPGSLEPGPIGPGPVTPEPHM